MLGIVVNGARRGELYSKYTYYHSYYTPKDEEPAPEDELPAEAAEEREPFAAAVLEKPAEPKS